MEVFVIFFLFITLICLIGMIYLDGIRDYMLKQQNSFTDNDFDTVRKLFWGFVVSLISSIVIALILLI